LASLALLFALLLQHRLLAIQPPLTSADLAQIRFDQKLTEKLSLDLEFTDEAGQKVTLQKYFHQKPALIVPGYYGCPMLCGMVANGIIEALQDIKATPGRDFEMVFISIDPNETPALAAAKKNSYLKRYGRTDSAGGWHFLTGSDAAIHAISSQIGFRYAYDMRSKQYAHPSGVVVVTPNGKIAQYLFGVSYSARELNEALKNASNQRISSPIKDLLLLCFHYTPITGKYGSLVMGLVRGTALLTLVAMAAGLFMARRRKGAA
jgi:protein SCO1/2